jgi:hypothetical protein
MELDIDTERGSRVCGPHWWVYTVGKATMGNKNISFLTETLPKLRFLWLFYLFGHHTT